MEFHITRESFLQGLSRVHTVVDARHHMANLRNLLLETQEDHLRIEGTNLEVSVRTRCVAEIVEPGAITVNARTLYDIVNELAAGSELVLRTDNRDRLRLTSGRAKFELSTLSAGQFPEIPQAVGGYRLTVDSGLLAEMLNKTHFAMSDDATRFVLNGVFLHVIPGATATGGTGRIRVVATDSHRLACVERELTGEMPEEERDLILPKKAVHEILRLLEKEDAPVELILDSDFIQVERPDVMLIAKLVEGRYPDYRQVLPRNPPMRLTVNREELLARVRRVSVLVMEKTSGIRLEIADGVMRFSTNNTEQGEAEEEMQVTLEGGDVLMVGFNARYVREFLSVMEGEEVSFLLNNEEQPVLLTDPYQLGTQFVLMPMRI
ncbi:DNA polymerase III subunit beta [Candidatus Magnetaquicoccus inordinatus]|uniref:DNA polymerase III subunit beta n=1 Tax=Candidatus Magnetaquicoccus inordinatus TaxID=2496818 RepID=UPI00102D17A8|nr:DNA polymerase III subunit beta [Candidatus Magnetaquicoccus inordinatus]